MDERFGFAKLRLLREPISDLCHRSQILTKEPQYIRPEY
jgi:hypothetical protein